MFASEHVGIRCSRSQSISSSYFDIDCSCVVSSAHRTFNARSFLILETRSSTNVRSSTPIIRISHRMPSSVWLSLTHSSLLNHWSWDNKLIWYIDTLSISNKTFSKVLSHNHSVCNWERWDARSSKLWSWITQCSFGTADMAVSEINWSNFRTIYLQWISTDSTGEKCWVLKNGIWWNGYSPLKNS